jgi:hypothetical protein
MNDFPFTIRDVLSAVSVPIRRTDGNFLYIDCPVCYEQNTKKKGKCQIRLDTNVFNCPRCGTGGGMLKLYSLIKNCSEKEANRAMREYVKSPTFNAKREQESYQKAVESTPKLVKLASKPVIDRTYRTLLSLCVLRKEHKQNLLKRGLTEKQIAHYGFKSVPWKNESDTIVKQLLEKGCTLKGVPGFYEEHGNWKMNVSYKNRGFFIPMLNIKGQCLGMQIRRDTSDPKYLWFSSSGYEKGCNRTSIPTFSNHWKIGKSVCITEGGLKAYVAHAHSGVTFIGIAGVTQFKILPLLFTQLKNAGVTTICDCFDMDYKENPHVRKARERLKEEIINAGFLYARYEWDANYKGIDDYLTTVPRDQRKMKRV